MTFQKALKACNSGVEIWREVQFFYIAKRETKKKDVLYLVKNKVEVSNMGNARVTNRFGISYLSETLDGGYLRNRLATTINGCRPKISRHQLIMQTFSDEIPETLVIDHINGDKMNNKLNNLRWVTVERNNNNRHYDAPPEVLAKIKYLESLLDGAGIKY